MTNFDVTVNSVIDRLPHDLSQVTATTVPVSTTSIETSIEEASSEMVALVKQAGFSVDSLPPEAKPSIQRAVRAYAASQALKAFGLIGDQYSNMMQEYEEVYTKFDSKTRRLGAKTKARTKTMRGSTSYGKGYQF